MAADPAPGVGARGNVRETGESGIDEPRLPPASDASLETGSARGSLFSPAPARILLMKAVKSSKDLVESALAQHRAGRLKEAESGYRKLLSRNPQHEQALFMLSVLLFESRRFEEASRYLERAVAIRPNQPVLLTNLGEAYRRHGNLERAAAAFERVLAEEPDFPEAHQNLGLTLMDAGATAEALPHLERAAALRPDNVRFQVSLAWVLSKLNRAEESLTHARRAVELDPNHAPAHHHLANALEEHGDRSGARASYRRAVELDPTDFDAHSNAILVALTDPSFESARLLAEARDWAKRYAEPLRERIRPHPNSRDPERTLRIGYVSPDFRAHPVRHFLKPLLQHSDRAAFEIYLYSSVEQPDSATEEYRRFAGERFRDIRRVDDVAAAELVRRDHIDILVDLAVHGTGRRLRIFACKPAPVQFSWLGYVGTTGLDSIDYRITDAYFDPPGTDAAYSEASLRLESFWCYDALEADLEVAPLPALAAGHVTFGSFNSFRKVHAGVLALWARVLCQVPGARLRLLAEPHARAGVSSTLAEAGVSADRVDFLARSSRREYLERYRSIDIGLDTFPFAGGTTTLDAAWMGVPVVTLSGDTALQRAGLCIAMNLGLPELVACSEDEFVAKAAALAADTQRLAHLRAELRNRLQTSLLMDAPRFARSLESGYRSAWRRYCAKS
jgi:protein O-GlcNAc transferase